MRLVSVLVLIHVSYLTSTSLALHVYHVRNIFSPLESFADSLFGITSTDSDTPSTILQSPVSTEAQPTATPIPVTVTAIAPSTAQGISVESFLPAPSSTSPPSVAPVPTTPSNLVSPSPVLTTEIVSPSRTPSISSSIQPKISESSANTFQPVASTTAVPTHDDPSGSKVSAGAIVVAVVFSLIIIGLVIYMVVKFHPATNAKFIAWRERRREKRSFRPGLVEKDEEAGIVKAKAITLTPIVIQKPRGLGLQNHDQKDIRSSEDTMVWTNNEPQVAQPQKPSRPFSFQFNLTRSPPTSQPARNIRRKPVPGAQQQYIPYSPGSIGVAVPMGTNLRPERISTAHSPLPASKRLSLIQRLRRISGLHEMP